GHPEGVTQLFLEVPLPASTMAAVAPATIGQNEQFACPWIEALPFLLPPACDGMNGELRGIVGHADIDIAFVPSHVVDAEGNRPALGCSGEVVLMHLLGLPAPCLPRIAELADQLLF